MKKITRLCITYLCLITSLSASEFAEVSVKEFPKVRTFSPAPAIAYPENAIATTFENHGNYWALLPAEKKAQFSLHVLNAKNPVKWETDTLSGIRDGKWRWLEADMHGYIWLSDGSQACRINVKNPQSGPVVISADTAFPAKKITAMGLGPNGSMLFATKNGKLVEAVQAYDNKARMQRNQITVIDCPKNVQKIYTDRHGTIWLKARNKAFKKEAPADAWQKNWERTWDLPGGSHDLSGDIYNGKFYMSWAITGDFGYPSKGNFHSKVLQFDPKSGWSIFADYGYPRGYGGTSFLDDKIWAVAGDALDKDKKRFTTRASQIIDPASGKVSNGPDLPAKLAASIALNVNGRLYVTGYGGEGKNLKLYSIGKGEDKWALYEIPVTF
ncbi:MAG: hypothetical protein HRT89_13740, partial [Lentisphaeria bacterium]|nr:hypothetical protein [Lentisphaeria bacterium]NQZ69120.1 hypothetical protein [Lentisphaeria bacterium]